MKKIIVILMFLISLSAYGTPKYIGIDNLGCGRYADELFKSHPKGMGNGCFTQESIFPGAYKAIDKLLSRGDVPIQEYSVRWSDTHSFSKKDFPAIVAEAKRMVPLIDKYPNVECLINGATEHQLNAQDASTLANQVLNVVPLRCKYVNNPWVGKGAFIKPTDRIMNEVHGVNAQPPKVGGAFVFSFDGDDMFDVNITGVKVRLSNAYFFKGWTSQNNGKRNASDPTPRPQRTFWPTHELFKMMEFALTTDQGNVKLPVNYLVKPKSDQHEIPPAPRELKPVFILPIQDKVIQLRGNGKVYNSTTGQAFADGRLRFYFPIHGYKMVREAGINVLQVGIVRKNKFISFGTANPGFRQGN